jgi:predicted homoserine dehydrogenase-like protein
MGHATGGDNLRPICDLQGRATRDLKAGHLLQMGGHHHTIDGVDAVIETATPVGPGSPLPFYLFSNLPIVRDVPAGKLICYEDVQLPVDSVLLRLRKEQDEIFGLTK